MAYKDSITNTEKAIALESCYANKLGKFYIPILTPSLDSDEPYKNKKQKPVASNIVSGNSSDMELQSYYESNYVELRTPFKVFKGSKVVINLLNGVNAIYDISNINIVGEYDEFSSEKEQSNSKTYSK